MTAISIFGGEFSHRQAWTHQPGVEARRFVCLVLCAMFAGAVCMYALRLGVCESTVHCLGRMPQVTVLLLRGIPIMGAAAGGNPARFSGEIREGGES